MQGRYAKMMISFFPERPISEQETQLPNLLGSRSAAEICVVAWPAAIQNVPPYWKLPKFSCRLWAWNVRQPSTERNHSRSWIWSGRVRQFRLDSHPPKISRSWATKKFLTSRTFSLLPAIAGKPPMLQKPIWKWESGFGTGRQGISEWEVVRVNYGWWWWSEGWREQWCVAWLSTLPWRMGEGQGRGRETVGHRWVSRRHRGINPSRPQRWEAHSGWK